MSFLVPLNLSAHIKVLLAGEKEVDEGDNPEDWTIIPMAVSVSH